MKSDDLMGVFNSCWVFGDKNAAFTNFIVIVWNGVNGSDKWGRATWFVAYGIPSIQDWLFEQKRR